MLERVVNARRSLDGLSVGDAFGELFFGNPDSAVARIEARVLPDGPWGYTDDTVMAMSIVDVLTSYGRIDQAALAALFSRRYRDDPARGYGGNMHDVLSQMLAGREWSRVSRSAFGGAGSMGNGGAMRAAPIGAYYWDDLSAAAEAARLSAEVTHAHPEGQAGAIAVAVAAAWVAAGGTVRDHLFDAILKHTPGGETREGILRASRTPASASVQEAVTVLGNGANVTAQDTVPFALWCAAHNLDSFEEALWETVAGLGDRDTTCAIVGGIVAARGSVDIPAAWLGARETLDHLALGA